MPIDYDFIRSLEGFKTSGYVPTKNGVPIGKSGVTIGTGIDLGQQSLESLRELGVDEQMLAQLQPYIGKRGKAAQNLLAKQPLNLVGADVELLDNAVMGRDFGRLARDFERASGQKFDSLPPEMQTTLASVKHQYGNLAKRTPDFWGQMTSGQHDRALENLRNFGDDFPTRRNKEADLFQQGLINQFLGQ